MRLDKFMSAMGIMSRSECAKATKRGEITVNGRVAARPEEQVEPECDAVLFRGVSVVYEKYRYIMMNKPAGVLSATEDGHGETVLDILPEELRRPGLFPCGRLDRDTEGFILLTDDGELAHRLLSPKHHVAKSYRFSLVSPISEQEADILRRGVDIGEKHITLPAELVLDEGGEAGVITITEGKFHQIKRMFAAVGSGISALERITFAGIPLDAALMPGECRILTDEEILLLRSCGAADKKNGAKK